MTSGKTPDGTLLPVRATVTLPNPDGPPLRAGQAATVDTSLPYIQECLAGGYLVALNTNERDHAR